MKKTQRLKNNLYKIGKIAVVAKWSKMPVFSNSSRESMPLRYKV